VIQYARGIAEAHSGSAVQDAVIAVPAFYGQAQRQALIDAAGLAGVNVMGLINTHTAAALQYGIERDFANKTQHVIFYDMGSGGTVVALVKYSSYTPKEGGSAAKPISQLEVGGLMPGLSFTAVRALRLSGVLGAMHMATHCSQQRSTNADLGLVVCCVFEAYCGC
jgi:hypothetical protein